MVAKTNSCPLHHAQNGLGRWCLLHHRPNYTVVLSVTAHGFPRLLGLGATVGGFAIKHQSHGERDASLDPHIGSAATIAESHQWRQEPLVLAHLTCNCHSSEVKVINFLKRRQKNEV